MAGEGLEPHRGENGTLDEGNLEPGDRPLSIRNRHNAGAAPLDQAGNGRMRREPDS